MWPLLDQMDGAVLNEEPTGFLGLRSLAPQCSGMFSYPAGHEAVWAFMNIVKTEIEWRGVVHLFAKTREDNCYRCWSVVGPDVVRAMTSAWKFLGGVIFHVNSCPSSDTLVQEREGAGPFWMTMRWRNHGGKSIHTLGPCFMPTTWRHHTLDQPFEILNKGSPKVVKAGNQDCETLRELGAGPVEMVYCDAYAFHLGESASIREVRSNFAHAVSKEPMLVVGYLYRQTCFLFCDGEALLKLSNADLPSLS
eukprot:Lankesteria_metandrocarpae@DN3270_c0_g1_i1.p1